MENATFALFSTPFEATPDDADDAEAMPPPLERIWRAVAGAWEPFLGKSIAEERARNVATILIHKDTLDEEQILDVLTRGLLMARLPQYGSAKLNGSTLTDAVNAAVTALADMVSPE